MQQTNKASSLLLPPRAFCTVQISGGLKAAVPTRESRAADNQGGWRESLRSSLRRSLCDGRWRARLSLRSKQASPRLATSAKGLGRQCRWGRGNEEEEEGGGCNSTDYTQSPALLGFISMVHTRRTWKAVHTHSGRGGGQERRERMGCRADRMEGWRGYKGGARGF